MHLKLSQYHVHFCIFDNLFLYKKGIFFPVPTVSIIIKAFLCAYFLAVPLLADSAEIITVTDFRGNGIDLPYPAKRIVCLIESALSGLYMLGAEGQVVGISSNVYEKSVFPYYAVMDNRIQNHELPAPGNWDFVNIERVIDLKPDLVIIWSNQEESIAALEGQKLPVYGVFIQRFEDIYKEIEDLGKLTGRGKRADDLVKTASQHMASIRTKITQIQLKDRKRVYYMWAQGELETSGRNSSVEELITISGAKNVAGHMQQEHLVVNMENILAWNPEIIVMWANDRKSPDDIMADTLWQSVSAVKRRQVHEFPDAFSCDLWTLKYIYAVTLVAKWCYPNMFDDLTPAGYKWKLLRQLYGEKLDAMEVQKYFPEPK